MIGAALVDRARVISTARSTVRVEGSFQTTTVHKPWFRCRFDPGGEGEMRTAGGVRRSRDATMLIGKRDLDGQELVFDGADVVEIQSRAFGRIRMQMRGAPEPIAKRRMQIGWLATLDRIDDKAAG